MPLIIVYDKAPYGEDPEVLAVLDVTDEQMQNSSVIVRDLYGSSVTWSVFPEEVRRVAIAKVEKYVFADKEK